MTKTPEVQFDKRAAEFLHALITHLLLDGRITLKHSIAWHDFVEAYTDPSVEWEPHP